MASSSKKARKSEPVAQSFPRLEAKTLKQKEYISALTSKDIIFALGDAGVGKTYVSTHYAAQQLFYRKVRKIILTRPAIEACGEELGFLPGELIDGKLLPYLIPYTETLNELLGKSFVDYCIKTGDIEPVPLAFMRGRSFKDCLILADEMQSATPMQMKLLLTRVGEGAKLMINGDINQRDRLDATGLEDAISRLKNFEEVGVIEFNDDDCIRSGICRKILSAYK